jgi:hypothetical protein
VNTQEQQQAEMEALMPDVISDWNETDIERPRDVYRETGKEFIFRGAITKALATIARNKREPAKSTNNMQLDLTLRAVDASGRLAGPEARYWVTVPLPNPKVPGHKPFVDGKIRDLQFMKGREFIRAVMGADALPEFPKEREGQKGVYFDPATGETLTIEQRKALVRKIDEKTVSLLVGWYNELRKTGSSELVNAVLYFGTKKQKAQPGKEGPVFTNVQYVRHDDGWRTVLTENFTE